MDPTEAGKRWTSIRKTPALVHLNLPNTWFDLQAEGYEYQAGPPFHLRLILDRNLPGRRRPRVRDDMGDDAEELAGGRLAELESIEIHDAHVLQALAGARRRLPQAATPWRLTIRLKKDWIFTVVPEVVTGRLVLRAVTEASRD